MSSISFPSYYPLSNGITTGALAVVNFNIVDPDVDGGVPAANATLFAANGKEMIVAITIIVATVVFVFFVLVFVGVISTIERRISNHDNK